MTQANRVYVKTATLGQGTVTLGAVVSQAFCTFAEAGVANGASIESYIIEAGQDFEIGVGIYNAGTLTRDTVRLSRINGVVGTSKMVLIGNATVRVIVASEDLAAKANLAGGNTFDGANTFNDGVQIGDVTLTPVNNHELVIGENEVIRFTGDFGGFKFGANGVAVYNEGASTAVTFQNSTPNSITELVIQPNGTPTGDPTAWAHLSINFQAGPNEERFCAGALYTGGARQYSFFQVALGTGQYHPVVFNGNGTSEAFRINADVDNSVSFTGRTSFGSLYVSPTATAVFVADADLATNGLAAQVQILGETNLNKTLLLGYDTTANKGSIQATTVGSSFDELQLNPNGGRVSANGHEVSTSMVLLNTITAPGGAGVATLSDTTSISSAFSDYALVFENVVPVTNGDALVLQVRSGGTFQTTSYLNVGAATTYIDLTGAATIANLTGKGYSGLHNFFNLISTTAYKHLKGLGSFFNITSGLGNVNAGGAWVGGTGAITGFRIQTTSGANIAEGVVKVYGIR